MKHRKQAYSKHYKQQINYLLFELSSTILQLDCSKTPRFIVLNCSKYVG